MSCSSSRHLTLLFLTQLILFCVCSCTKHKTPNKSHSWLALLGSLCSAHVRVRLLTHWLALRTCDTGQRWGGGQWRLLCLACFAWLALLGSRPVQAADALAHAARLRPRAKMGGGKLCLACLGFRLRSRLRANMGGWQWPSAHAACLQPRTKLGGGGSKASFALLAKRLV